MIDSDWLHRLATISRPDNAKRLRKIAERIRQPSSSEADIAKHINKNLLRKITELEAENKRLQQENVGLRDAYDVAISGMETLGGSND